VFGNGITLILEKIDEIINGGINKDIIEYKPYLDFDKVNSYLNIETKETEIITENVNNN
jgi:hypothetical protein